MRIPHAVSVLLALLTILKPVNAAVMEFIHNAQWQNAAGIYTTIDFTGFPDHTVITNQYAQQGITFTNGSDWIIQPGYFADGAGLETSTNGLMGTMRLSFAGPEYSLAMDYVGIKQFKLYYLGQLTYTSSVFDDV